MKNYYQKDEDGIIIAIWNEATKGENEGIEILSPVQDDFILNSGDHMAWKESSAGHIEARTQEEMDADILPDNRTGSEILNDILDGMAAEDQITMLVVFEKYNSFGRFLDRRNWIAARGRLAAALAAGDMTQEQHDQIESGIPTL